MNNNLKLVLKNKKFYRK